jgi:hypothetical protein
MGADALLKRRLRAGIGRTRASSVGCHQRLREIVNETVEIDAHRVFYP